MLFNRKFDYSNFLLYDFYLVFKGGMYASKRED